MLIQFILWVLDNNFKINLWCHAISKHNHYLAYQTFNSVLLLKLADRDNCMNKTTMKKKEINQIFTGNKTLDFTWSALSILVDDIKGNINIWMLLGFLSILLKPCFTEISLCSSFFILPLTQEKIFNMSFLTRIENIRMVYH